MLEGENNDMLVALEGGRAIGPRETFCNNNLDPTLRITGIPVLLL
jgi:hypothetical protein